MQESYSVGGGVLDPQGPVASGNAQILINSVGIMLVIVIPTILATLAFAWWFRASNKKATYRPNWAHSGHLELIVWGIPLLVVLFLSGLIWIGSHDLDPARPLARSDKTIDIQVVSLDWKWLFIYPDDRIAVVNELVIPVDAAVQFSLTSGTVMNSFFVPQLGSMIATMNGMVTHLHLQADHVGDYYGQSAQFSGKGFADMHFTLRAVSREEYSQWLSQVRQSKNKLDDGAYLELARTSDRSPILQFGSIQEGIFDAIAARKLNVGHNPTSSISH
jgi:cytochrome o ubiquinol oxidase subunit 2